MASALDMFATLTSEEFAGLPEATRQAVLSYMSLSQPWFIQIVEFEVITPDGEHCLMG
jgi:hypothetical protein